MKRTLTTLLATGVAAFALLFFTPAQSEAQPRPRFQPRPPYTQYYRAPRPPVYRYQVRPGPRYYYHPRPYYHDRYYYDYRRPGGRIDIGPLRFRW